MPPFTFNLCQNGNFFGSFHFGFSSCRHFVDSLKHPHRGCFFHARKTVGAAFGRLYERREIGRCVKRPCGGVGTTPSVTAAGRRDSSLREGAKRRAAAGDGRRGRDPSPRPQRNRVKSMFQAMAWRE